MSDLISREEAIKAMQESEFGFTFEVDVAIEAVKALPTVKPEGMGKMSEDLISRKEMIRAVDSLGEDNISYYKLLLLIGKMPSAEPVRTAKVENIEDPAGMGAYGDCSECGAEVNEQYAYCPNCGARLEWE